MRNINLILESIVDDSQISMLQENEMFAQQGQPGYSDLQVLQTKRLVQEATCDLRNILQGGALQEIQESIAAGVAPALALVQEDAEENFAVEALNRGNTDALISSGGLGGPGVDVPAAGAHSNVVGQDDTNPAHIQDPIARMAEYNKQITAMNAAPTTLLGKAKDAITGTAYTARDVAGNAYDNVSNAVNSGVNTVSNTAKGLYQDGVNAGKETQATLSGAYDQAKEAVTNNYNAHQTAYNIAGGALAGAGAIAAAPAVGRGIQNIGNRLKGRVAPQRA